MNQVIKIGDGERQIWLNPRHGIYEPSVLKAFEHFYGAVVPCDGIVDYSQPTEHCVTGFDDVPIFFPSLADSFETCQQYLDFAEIEPGQRVFDLGGYSGLTAIAFAKAGAIVVVLEPDPESHLACKRNLESFSRMSGTDDITLLNSAVSDVGGTMQFSAEGAPGSASSSLIGNRGGSIVEVNCITLSDLADEYGIPDVIKMDIEGSELEVIRASDNFFSENKPRLIIEAHKYKGKKTEPEIVRILTRYGYECDSMSQTGHWFPLVTARAR